MDNNEKRAGDFLERFGFSFKEEYRGEIRRLLEVEFSDYQQGSSEYLRVLCGFLFCIGNVDDVELIEKIKLGINMDIGAMIDSEWIESMKGVPGSHIRTRDELLKDYVSYYVKYFNL